ncbi:MAG: MBL fold metallo-hydrolase [Myxococcota bacterium]
MDTPVMFRHRPVAADTDMLPAYMPVPGMGVLAVNAFVIRGTEPVLVDAGLGALRGDFLAQLESVVDLSDLRWIWITHTDPDHVGNLQAVLERAPAAKVITTYLGMGKMGMLDPVPPDRVHLLNPGQRLVANDRTLIAVKPPTFDAPETTALVDTQTGALFSSDCFGAVLGEPQDAAADIAPGELREGAVTWTSVDAPWLHATDERHFERSLQEVRQIDPTVVLSSHLPPARGMTSALLEHLRVARRAAPFVGPDQQALTQMLAAVA